MGHSIRGRGYTGPPGLAGVGVPSHRGFTAPAEVLPALRAWCGRPSDSQQHWMARLMDLGRDVLRRSGELPARTEQDLLFFRPGGPGYPLPVV